MLKKQAPGETILKVGGMLLLFLGVLLAFGSGNTLSLVMKGSSDSAVVEYLNQNGMTYSQLVASNVMVLVAGVIYLAAGVVGVKQAGKVENAGLCVGMGGLLIAEVVAEVIVTMILLILLYHRNIQKLLASAILRSFPSRRSMLHRWSQVKLLSSQLM